LNLAKKTVVTLSANFERNLESIEIFLAEAEAQHVSISVEKYPPNSVE